MGQRNMAYTGPMNDSEIEHAHLQPEPCVIPYGRITTFPSRNTSIPGARAVPVPIGHGLHNQLAFPSHQGKTAEGFPVNFQYFYTAPGSSSYVVPDYNVIPVVMGPRHRRGARNRAIDHNPFMPMSQGGQPLQVVPSPWLDYTPGIPFMPGYTNGYPVTFVHHPVGPHSPPPTMPPLRGNMVQNGFVGPPSAGGVRGVEMLNVSNYGRRIDHHRDMRLDIDDMSYEELLALGEQIGNAGSGLSEDFILGNLKTRTFTSSRPEEGSSTDSELAFCTICQMDYDDEQMIGTLDCSHEYHVDCINKWLSMKNSCPVCKCTALVAQGNDSGNVENS